MATIHPACVAEKAAALNLVNNGRVEMGIDEGASITELSPFDTPMDKKRAIWEDAVRAILPMFRDGGCEYEGKRLKFALRNVVPKPVQQPNPSLWVACSQLDTTEMAGQRGMGALGFQFISAEAAHAWVHAYTKPLDKLTEYVTNPISRWSPKR